VPFLKHCYFEINLTACNKTAPGKAFTNIIFHMVLLYRTILPRKSLCLERAFSKTSVVALSFLVRELVKYEKGKRKREKF
jgi:hypothetical protein